MCRPAGGHENETTLRTRRRRGSAFQRRFAICYLAGMPTALKKMKSKAKAAKLRSWRVAILRNRAQYLGEVQAPDEKAAEAAAVVCSI